MNRTATVLITGATGSIGRKVRAHLEARGGFHLRLLRINPSKDPGVTTADLAEYDDEWARQFEDVDAVIHLAGALSTRSPWDVVQRLNIDLSLNVFRAAQRYRARRIVFASSNWVVAGHRFSGAYRHLLSWVENRLLPARTRQYSRTPHGTRDMGSANVVERPRPV